MRQFHSWCRAVMAAGTLFLLLGSPLGPVARADALADELATQVTIRRDTWGVPHILAKTEEAVYFGQGYACAEDHCLLMARAYLNARGEAAAHFGEEFVAMDFLVKRIRIWEVAKENFPKLPPWVQRKLDAYALGYNRYVSKHRAELPDWVQPVTGVDVLALSRRQFVLGFSMDPVILRRFLVLGAKPAPGKGKGAKGEEESARARRDSSFRLPPSTLEVGSNMWALNKERSASGKALLMGNPHLSWNGLFILHEAHLTVPGKLNLMGTNPIGGPGMVLGFNDHLGWSHTVNLHDSDDLYELTLTPDGTGYLYEGRPLPLRREELSIQVKTDQGLVTRKLEAFRSHYGPTLKLPGGKALAWKSANFDECRLAEQWALMGKAKDLQEFRAALDLGALTMFNICYADKDGNCFYLFNGRFPDRPQGYKWEGIVPGGTPATEWNRMLPQARLPWLLNPPGGYVQNCNSSPWYTNLKAPLDRHKYPEDLTPNFNLMRQQHGLLLLNGDDKLSLDDIKQRKHSMKLLLADRVKDDLVKLARGQTVDGVDLAEAVWVLEAWDNTVSRASKGSLLFTEFWTAYTKAVGAATVFDRASAAVAERAKLYRVPWDEKRPAETPLGIANAAAARTALAATAKALKAKYGKIDVVWGDVHRLRRGQLDVPLGGYRCNNLGLESGAFRAMGYREAEDGKRVAYGGDSYVFAVEFTTPPTAYSISAYSQSSDPKSPHHADQSALFAREEWKRAWFTEEDIAKNTKRAYRP